MDKSASDVAHSSLSAGLWARAPPVLTGCREALFARSASRACFKDRAVSSRKGAKEVCSARLHHHYADATSLSLVPRLVATQKGPSAVPGGVCGIVKNRGIGVQGCMQ